MQYDQSVEEESEEEEEFTKVFWFAFYLVVFK